jgi:hypothetical protein
MRRNMYCPECGARLERTLNYCKQCGADLTVLNADRESVNAATTTDSLVWVIVGTTITFLGMVLGAMVLMKDGSIDETLGTAFVILSFATLLFVEGILLWRLLRLNRVSQGTRRAAQFEGFDTPEMGPATERSLPEPAPSAPGVTEHTTRNFEPQYTKTQQ